ncbi:MMPL family transporter [Streptomyces sp. YIM 98790]|uniref:MMPL family transporter n=1 Tax=Streptomyces sp. YIM 98790 TaxID=2689077 RepID=UPI00140D2D08|nr:MMPL family transporter [Streptomyces sp. YIM 98790]
MATLLYKLGRFSFRRRWWVALVWVLLLVAAIFAASSVSGEAEEDFSMPGTESQEAFDLLEREFPQAANEGLESRIVFQAPDGESIEDHQAVIDSALNGLEDGENVTEVTDPFDENNGAMSPEGDAVFSTVTYQGNWDDITENMRDELFHAMDEARDAGLTVEASGPVAAGEGDVGQGELLGVLVAAIVLTITFGSLVAAGLPLLTALMGLFIGISGIVALGPTFGLSENTTVLATMIGMALGIDYALFIVSRYRAELIAGFSREEAIGRAAGTAGSAVVFAGATVTIALAGLTVVNVPVLTRMGLSSAATVVIAVAVALTLVPAMMGIAGKMIFGRRVRKANPDTLVPPQAPRTFFRRKDENFGTRWARGVLRRPAMVLVASVVGLGALAVPVSQLELGLPDDSTAGEETTQRRAYDMLGESFGPGFNGPLLMVLDGTTSEDPAAAADRINEELSGHDGIVSVTPPVWNDNETIATMTAFPTTGPNDPETDALVSDLRGGLAPELKAETGTQMLVTGTTAVNNDFSDVLNDALVPYLALVVGLAFLLLMIVFRSVLVPLTAALGFLLSVLGALGAVIAVFQKGWGASLLGVSETAPVISFLPIFMIGVIFGLAMDYQVFLGTRIREGYVHGEPARTAVVTGFNLNARVVTAAAIIMTSVFLGFVTASDPIVKSIGFGLAAAILLDAFIVRMTLTPAVLGLLGDRAWWLPRWLNRLLPDVDVEGASLERYLTAAGRGRTHLEKEREPVGVG